MPLDLEHVVDRRGEIEAFAEAGRTGPVVDREVAGALGEPLETATRKRWRRVDLTAPRIEETSRVVDSIPAFVNRAMVSAAEEHEVSQRCLTALRPVTDVVGVDEPAVLAAWEAAAAVAPL